MPLKSHIFHPVLKGICVKCLLTKAPGGSKETRVFSRLILQVKSMPWFGQDEGSPGVGLMSQVVSNPAYLLRDSWKL